MEINLRKANALQLAIQDAVKSIKFETEIKINEFQIAEDEITKRRIELVNKQGRQINLLNSLYTIRKTVSQANHQNGINDKLADLALIEKKIQHYVEMSSKSVRESVEVVAGKLEKLRNRKDEGRSLYYGHDATVDTSIFTADDLVGLRATVVLSKKIKQTLQDELLDLNVRTEIELSDDLVNLLTDEGLL